MRDIMTSFINLQQLQSRDMGVHKVLSTISEVSLTEFRSKIQALFRKNVQKIILTNSTCHPGRNDRVFTLTLLPGKMVYSEKKDTEHNEYEFDFLTGTMMDNGVSCHNDKVQVLAKKCQQIAQAVKSKKAGCYEIMTDKK